MSAPAQAAAVAPAPASAAAPKPKLAPAWTLPRPVFHTLGREGLAYHAGPRKLAATTPDAQPIQELVNQLDAQVTQPFEARRVIYSKNGQLCAVLQASSVAVFAFDDSKVDEAGKPISSMRQLTKLDMPNTVNAALSPHGSFLVTLVRPVKGQAQGNLCVWSLPKADQDASAAAGAPEVVMQLHHKNAEIWPAVKWTNDESIAGHMVTNEVRVFNGKDLAAGSIQRIRSVGVNTFELARDKEGVTQFALFSPEAKGKPAQIAVFPYPGINHERPRARKTMFKAQSAKLVWNEHGTALLATTETAVDTSGQSYYGSSVLHLMHADGQYDCIVLPTKEGMVQDVQWSPTGNNFVLIGGRMPCNSTLYNFQGDPIFEFGQKHRNTIRWSPSGRFLLLGGFGNLAGDVDFWDVNKRALISTINAHSAVMFEWAPDGRTFMMATLSPRMRVDNGYTLYSYRGEIIHKQAWESDLYDCAWRPAAEGVYPDRPQSPVKGRPAIADGASAFPVAKAAPASVAKQAYRAPGSSGSLAAMMRGDRESSAVSAGKVGKYVVPGRNGSIPGLAPVAPKKKTRKRGKKTVDAGEAKPAEPEVVKVEDPVKVLKKLNKLMRQIDDLCAVQAKGETLSAEQLTKVGRKTEVEAEMAKLSL